MPRYNKIDANIIRERADLCPNLACPPKRRARICHALLADKPRRLENVGQIHADIQDGGDLCLLAMLNVLRPAGLVRIC